MPFHPGKCLLPLAFFILADVESAHATITDLLTSEGFIQIPLIHSPEADTDMVEVVIEGHKFRLLIDTGAPYTVLTRYAASRAHLESVQDLGASYGLNGIADKHMQLARVHSFKMHGIDLASSPLVFSTFNGATEEDGDDFDGLLGITALKRNNAVFCYDPALLFIRPQGGPGEKLQGFMQAARFDELQMHLRQQGRYYIPTAFNGVVANALLDSGAEFTTLDENLAKTAGMKPTLNLIHAHLEGIDGRRLESFGIRPKTISLVTIRVNPMVIMAADLSTFDAFEKSGIKTDAFLGFDLLGTMHAVLDVGNDRLYFFPNPAAR